MSIFYCGRRIAADTPVYDHAGSPLFNASRDRVIDLIKKGKVDIIGTRKRIRGLRFQGPDPALLTGGSHFKRPMGTPHRNENSTNVRGVWHIDRIPDILRCDFFTVISGQIVFYEIRNITSKVAPVCLALFAV